MPISADNFKKIGNLSDSQIAEFSAALTYLQGSSIASGILQKLINTPLKIFIGVGSDKFDSSTNTLFWSPSDALSVRSNTENGPAAGSITTVDSAAISLIHECAHAVDYYTNLKEYLIRKGTDNKQYENDEEKYAVGIENNVAKQLGELGGRLNHSQLDIEPNPVESNPTEGINAAGFWQEQSFNGQVTVTGGESAFPLALDGNEPVIPNLGNLNTSLIEAEAATISIAVKNPFSKLPPISAYTITGDNNIVYAAKGNLTVTINGSLTDILNFGTKSSPVQISGEQESGLGADVTQGGNVYSWAIDGTQYQFVTTNGNLESGKMTIIGSSGTKFVINGFNLLAAENFSGLGFDGIHLNGSNVLAPGAPSPTSFANPSAGVSVPGIVELLTVYATAQNFAQTETVAVQGATGFYGNTGSGMTPINGSFTVTIPAGQESVSFGLVDANTSTTAQTVQVTATLNSDSAVSNTVSVTFPGASGAAPNPVISLTDPGTGTGQASVNATQLAGGNGSTAGSGGPAADTWTGSDGSTYKFAPNSANIGQGFGTLTITGGNLAAGDQVTVANFNLATATSSSGSGYLGITLEGQYALENGVSASPFTTTGGTLANTTANNTGTSIPLVLYVPSGNTQARTINLTLSGGTASQYQVIVGGSTESFSGNSAAITIPAGATSVPITLNYVGTSKTAQSVSLSLSAPGGAAIETNTLTATDYSSAGNGTGGSGTSNASNPLVTNDAITVTGSNGVIYGNGTPSIIEAGAQNNGGNTVYADTQISLATALSNTKSQPATTGAGSFIYTQDGNNNTIVGGTENDTIVTGNGNNTVFMGSGNSTYVGGVDVSSVNSNWSVGVSGTQITTSSSVQFAATAAPAAGYSGNTFTTGSGTVNTVGVGNDTIYGGAGKNTYVLSNGNNYLDAGSGNDTIDIGTGQNTIFAGSGNDVINGGGGASYIDTESGNDYVYLNGGQNTVYGGSGNELIYSGSAANWASAITTENNLIEAGTGNDTLYGAGGNDTLDGGPGTDVIYGGNGTELINVGDGGVKGAAATVYAGSGATTVNGGSGLDWINGGSGNNVLNAGDGGTSASPTMVIAGSGDTTINGGLGVDYLKGGSGNDVINLGDGGIPLYPTLAYGGSGNDTINCGLGVDNVLAGSGNDLINAGDGDSVVIEGGKGNDTMVSGAGNDLFVGGSGTGTNTYQINAGGGFVTIETPRAGDTLVFGAGLTIGDLASVTQFYGITTFIFDDGTNVVVQPGGMTQATFGDGTVATFAQLLSNQFTAGGVTESAINATLPQASGPGTSTLNLYGSANVVGQGNNVNLILVVGAANNTLIGNGTTIIVVLTDSAVTICATPIKTLAANDCAWNQYALL